MVRQRFHRVDWVQVEPALTAGLSKPRRRTRRGWKADSRFSATPITPHNHTTAIAQAFRNRDNDPSTRLLNRNRKVPMQSTPMPANPNSSRWYLKRSLIASVFLATAIGNLLANEPPKISPAAPQNGVFVSYSGFMTIVLELQDGHSRFWLSSDLKSCLSC